MAGDDSTQPSAGTSGGSSGSGGSSNTTGPGTGGTTGGSGGSSTTGTGGGAVDSGAGCTPAAALICNPMIPTLPNSIKDTGIFTALPDLSKHHERAHLFEPNPPLWSDGLSKERLLILPPGAVIDNSDSKKWKFPMGTVFVKNFFDDGGPNKTRRPIETRFIRHLADPNDPFVQWQFAVYKWNADGTDATLIDFSDAMKTTPVQVVVDRMEGGGVLRINNGMPFTHTIPSKQNCGECHDNNAKLTDADIIGFDELRLNWKLPGAATTQLQALHDAKLLSTMPAQPITIVEPNPVLARVKTWVQGNCVHCHNGAEGMLDLRPDGFVANTVNKMTQGSGIMPPSGWLRVVPKKPEMSVLYVQARRAPLPTGPTVQMRPMPPVGVEVADMNRVAPLPTGTMLSQVPTDPIADIATWINSL